MMRVRILAAVLLAFVGVHARAEDAVRLQLVTQPQNGGADARSIDIDAGDPVTIGAKLALLVTATAETTVDIRYTPSDGKPAMLASGLALKAGESKRLPEDGGWYHVSSGLEKRRWRRSMPPARCWRRPAIASSIPHPCRSAT